MVLPNKSNPLWHWWFTTCCGRSGFSLAPQLPEVTFYGCCATRAPPLLASGCCRRNFPNPSQTFNRMRRLYKKKIPSDRKSMTVCLWLSNKSNHGKTNRWTTCESAMVVVVSRGGVEAHHQVLSISWSGRADQHMLSLVWQNFLYECELVTGVAISWHTYFYPVATQGTAAEQIPLAQLTTIEK